MRLCRNLLKKCNDIVNFLKAQIGIFLTYKIFESNFDRFYRRIQICTLKNDHEKNYNISAKNTKHEISYFFDQIIFLYNSVKLLKKISQKCEKLDIENQYLQKFQQMRFLFNIV